MKWLFKGLVKRENYVCTFFYKVWLWYYCCKIGGRKNQKEKWSTETQLKLSSVSVKKQKAWHTLRRTQTWQVKQGGWCILHHTCLSSHHSCHSGRRSRNAIWGVRARMCVCDLPNESFFYGGCKQNILWTHTRLPPPLKWSFFIWVQHLRE